MRRSILALIALLAVAAPARAQLPTEVLLDTLQHSAFNYFWNEMNPVSGLMPDRSVPTSPCSIASEGFGLSAICVAIDHGWITRAEGRGRVRTALETLWNGPQGTSTTNAMGYRGLYYHFLKMDTGLREWSSELSTIDTALLFAGILDCKMYFTDAGDAAEVRIRALADSIYYRADWDFMRNGNAGILMGWKPESGFTTFGEWVGYNEAMILYILALGSPTHPVPDTAWTRWTSGYTWATQYGLTYVLFPPLFGHQYSHCWIDFRGIRDTYMQGKGIDYFENSRRATMAQRRYCTRNPLNRVGYGENLWGLTACDDPISGYLAHGAPPTQNDNGTLAPTAALSSMPFAPDTCIAAAQFLWTYYRNFMWGPYGFVDAYNLSQSPEWYDIDYLGIDQGPIVLMIENYRTNAIWSRFMRNPDIAMGLYRAGFLPVLAVDPAPAASIRLTLSAAPNPFREGSTVRFRLPQAMRVRLGLYDLAGREVARLVDGEQGAGEHAVGFDGRGLASGVYYYRLQAGDQVQTAKSVRLE